MKYLVIILIGNIHLFTSDLAKMFNVELYKGASWDVMQFSNGIAFFLLSIIIFQKTPIAKINERSVIALFLYYMFFNILSFWPWVLYRELPIYPFYILIGTYLLRSIFVSKRNQSEYSDSIKDNNVYLCLERSGKARGVFTSLVGSPFCSISIYVDNHLYGFKWSKNIYLKRKISKSNLYKKYTIIDTQKRANDKSLKELDALLGSTATYGILPRVRCIWIIRRFLEGIGPEYRPKLLEHMPSLYAKKIIGTRNDR